MHYQDDEVPEAKFSYDISPLATVISSKKRAWYEFLTSLMAIIGGTFTGECMTCPGQVERREEFYFNLGKGA